MRFLGFRLHWHLKLSTWQPWNNRGSLGEEPAPTQIMGATGPIIIVPEKKDSIWNKWDLEQQSGGAATTGTGTGSTGLPATPQPETPTTPAPG